MTEGTSSSPSERLAEVAVRRLIAKGLLTDEAARGLAEKIGAGKVRGSDWKLAFEKALQMHKRK